MALEFFVLILYFLSPVLSEDTDSDSYLVLPSSYTQNKSKPKPLDKDEIKPNEFQYYTDVFSSSKTSPKEYDICKTCQQAKVFDLLINLMELLQNNSDLDPALLQDILETLKNYLDNNIPLKDKNVRKLDSHDDTNSIEKEGFQLNEELQNTQESSSKLNRVCETCQDAKIFDLMDNLLKLLKNNSHIDPVILKYILKFLKKHLKSSVPMKQLESRNFLNLNEIKDNKIIDRDYLRQFDDPAAKSNTKFVLKFEFDNPSRPECKDAVMNLLQDIFHATIKLSQNSMCSQNSKFTINDVPVAQYEINIEKNNPAETRPINVPQNERLNNILDRFHYLPNDFSGDSKDMSQDYVLPVNTVNQIFQEPMLTMEKNTETPLLTKLSDLINDLANPNTNVGKYPKPGNFKKPYDIQALFNNPKSDKLNPSELQSLLYKLLNNNQNTNVQLPKPQDSDDSNQKPTLLEIQQLLNNLPNLDKDIVLSPNQKLNNNVEYSQQNNVNNIDLRDLKAIINQLYPNNKDAHSKQNILNFNKIQDNQVPKNPLEASLNPNFSEQMNINSGPLLKYGPYVKYQNVADLQKWLSVTNLYKLSSLPNKSGLIELTYMLKQPMPLIYQPIYFVKYTLPYATFLHNLKELLTKPHLRSNVVRLYQELISKSNITKLSPDLKNYKKQEILKLVSNNGTLVRARLLSSKDMFLNEQLKVIRDLNANLQTDLNESDNGDLKHIYNNIAYPQKVAPNS